MIMDTSGSSVHDLGTLHEKCSQSGGSVFTKLWKPFFAVMHHF